MGRVLYILAFAFLVNANLYSDSTTIDSFQLNNPDESHHSIGVLVYASEKSKGIVCNATHIALGKVLTSARCLSSSSDLSQYSLIFYNLTGKRTVIPIEKIYFTGPLWVDVAVLSISNQNAKMWEVAGAEIKQYPVQNVFDQYWNDTNETESVDVWGYTASDKANILKFTKSKCKAARKIPVIEMKVKENESEKTVHEWQVTGEDVNPDQVLFLGECTESLSNTNGLLITAQKNYSKKIGLLSQYTPDLGKIYTTQSQSQYKEQETEFYFRGILPPSTLLSKDFSDLIVHMGTLLQSATAVKKDLFQNLY